MMNGAFMAILLSRPVSPVRPRGGSDLGTVALTGDVQDGVRVPWVVLEQLNGLGGGAHDQLHAALLCFRLDLVHDGEVAEHAGPDDQALALPGDLFLRRHRRVAELLPELPRRFLFPPAEFTPVQDDVLGVLLPVDLEGADLALAPLHGTVLLLVLVEQSSACRMGTAEIRGFRAD